MNEMGWLVFLKHLSLICNGLGIVIALSFLLGPKLLAKLGSFLDAHRSSISMEQVLVTKARLVLGLTLLIIAGLMFALVINTPM